MTSPGTSYQWKKFGVAPMPRFPGLEGAPATHGSEPDLLGVDVEKPDDANREGYEVGYAAGLKQAEEDIKNANQQQVELLKAASQEVVALQSRLESNLLEEVLVAVQGCFKVLFAYELTLNSDLLHQLKSTFAQALESHPDKLTLLLSPTDSQALAGQLGQDECLNLEVDPALSDGVVRARSATLLAELNLPEQLRGLLEEFTAHQESEDDEIDHS